MLRFLRFVQRRPKVETIEATASLGTRIWPHLRDGVLWAITLMSGASIAWWSTALLALPLAVGFGIMLAAVLRWAWLNERSQRVLNVIPAKTETISLPPSDGHLAAIENQIAQIDGNLKTALIRINAMDGRATVQTAEFEKRLTESLDRLMKDQRAIETKFLAAVSEAKAHATDSLHGTRDGMIHYLNQIERRQANLDNRIEELQKQSFEMISALNAEKVMMNLDTESGWMLERLIEADQGYYKTEDAWLAEYNKWRQKIEEFWLLVSRWSKGARSPFNPPVPPDEEVNIIPHIKLLTSHKALYHFQMLVLANDRHLSWRGKAYEFIASKASPP